MITIMNLVDFTVTARACFKLSNVTCTGDGRNLVIEAGKMSKESCKLACHLEERCNFFFWRADGHCVMHDTCDDLTISENPGIIYAIIRDNYFMQCPGTISIKLKDTSIFIQFKENTTKLIHFSKFGVIMILDKKCSDGFQNPSEAGVDCGGLCKPCSKNDKIIDNRILSKYSLNLISKRCDVFSKILIVLFIRMRRQRPSRFSDCNVL